jgi:hypothetical protein
VDGAGERGAVHPVRLRQGGVRELEARHDQGDDHPVDEHQLVVRAGSWRAPTVVTSAFTRPPLPRGRPGVGELDDEFAKAPRGEAGEDTLGQGRAAQVSRHDNTQAARPTSCPDSAPIVTVHHVVKLVADAKTASALGATLRACNEAANFVSRVA